MNRDLRHNPGQFGESAARETGFTLIEVLIGLVILTVGLLGLVHSVNSVMRYQQSAANMTKATMYSTNKLEEIKRLATNEPTGGSYGFSYLVSDYLSTEGMTEVSNKKYSKTEEVESGIYRTWSLEIYPSSSTDTFEAPESIQMVEVVVQTQWTDAENMSKNVELGAVLHRRQFLE